MPQGMISLVMKVLSSCLYTGSSDSFLSCVCSREGEHSRREGLGNQSNAGRHVVWMKRR